MNRKTWTVFFSSDDRCRRLCRREARESSAFSGWKSAQRMERKTGNGPFPRTGTASNGDPRERTGGIPAAPSSGLPISAPDHENAGDRSDPRKGVLAERTDGHALFQQKRGGNRWMAEGFQRIRNAEGVCRVPSGLRGSGRGGGASAESGKFRNSGNYRVRGCVSETHPAGRICFDSPVADPLLPESSDSGELPQASSARGNAHDMGAAESLRFFWIADAVSFPFRFLCLRRLRRCLPRNRESNCASVTGSGRKGSCGEN